MAVYFIRPVGMAGPVKIGCSDAPFCRLAALATWSPFPLEIVAQIEEGDQALERRIHGIFKDSHSHKEWFHESDVLTRLIDRLSAGERIETLIDMSAPVVDFRPRRIFTAEYRRFLSYRHRLRWAFGKLREQDEDGRWYEPSDVYAIMHRWSGWQAEAATLPSPEEVQRLDQVLANPAAHAVFPPWRVEEATQ